MTPSQLITYINNQITSNGNNEITAEVLRPILTAMVNQINSLVGNKNNLPTGETNLISALNNINTSGITIHSGIEDPNETSPVSFNLGDFYKQEVDNVIIDFWQYNGNQWIEIITRQEQKERNLTSISDSYSIIDTDDIIIYLGNSGKTLTLPDASLYFNRILRIANFSSFILNLSRSISVNFTIKTTIGNSENILIVSDGFIWRQINN